MELAYNYQARNPRGKLSTGLTYAPSRALAYARLKRNGFTPYSVKLNVVQSVKGVIWREFDPKELARFYGTIGRRLKAGKPMIEGLDGAIEYVQDERLRQAIMMMRQAVLDGQSEWKAMELSDFPPRDCRVVRSTSEANKAGDAFVGLSEEISRVTEMRQAMSSIFRMPVIMTFIMYAFFYVTLVWLAPGIAKFLKSTNLRIRLSWFNQAYFDFATVFNEHLVLSSIVYWTVPVLLFFLARSDYFKRLLDKIPRLRSISVKSDHASLWRSYALLYDAAIPVKESCRILAKAAKRSDSRESFDKMAQAIDAGYPESEAVARSGFPAFVVNGVRSAVSSSSLTVGLLDMVTTLEEDVRVATQILQENAKILSVLLMALGLALLFMVTYYPMASTVLSNL